MSGRPLVGVTGSARGSGLMWWFNSLAVWRAGGRAIRIHPGRPYPIEELDALVVGGGDDIHAELYGGDISLTIRVDPARDRLELAALDIADGRDLPLLGICRGAQILNVHRGGSLHGEIRTAYADAVHRRTALPRKRVRVAQESLLGRLLECEACLVNALHHQSIDRLGEGLRIVAQDRDGMVQAVEAPGSQFVLGVQWHPEFLFFRRGQQRIFRALVQAA